MTRRLTGGFTAIVLVGLLALVVLEPCWAAADSSAGSGPQEFSLPTETTEEAFALAISLSRKG